MVISTCVNIGSVIDVPPDNTNPVLESILTSYYWGGIHLWFHCECPSYQSVQWIWKFYFEITGILLRGQCVPYLPGANELTHPSIDLWAESRFAPSQWETSLLCNKVSHWLGANLESALDLHVCGEIADGKFIPFLPANVWISLKISLKFVPKGWIINIPVLVQIMAWQPGDKPLSEPMMVSFLMHICITWPQWVKNRMYICIVISRHWIGCGKEGLVYPAY